MPRFALSACCDDIEPDGMMDAWEGVLAYQRGDRWLPLSSGRSIEQHRRPTSLQIRCRIEKTFTVSGNVPPSILSLPYIRLVYLSRIPPKGFTRTDICGMNREVTGARILLSLSPDTGTGSATQTVPLLDPSHNPCLNRLHHA